VRRSATCAVPTATSGSAIATTTTPRTTARASAFAYDGQQFDVGIGWAFPAIDASAEAGYRYRDEDYAPASNGRRDQESGPSFVIGKRFTDWLAVSAAYFGTFNHSNQPLFFQYNRQIGSVQLEARF
jgi:hypothetical protein